MPYKSGIVKAVKQRENNFSILMDEEIALPADGKREAWFSGWDRAPSKGERVEFEWEWDDPSRPTFRNIVKDSLKRGEVKTEITATDSIRLGVKNLINECIDDALDIMKNRSEVEKDYIEFNSLLDQIRRTRLAFEINARE